MMTREEHSRARRWAWETALAAGLVLRESEKDPGELEVAGELLACEAAGASIGHLRVGYEDSPCITGGARASNNIELVEDAVAEAERGGRRVVRAGGARDLLGLSRKEQQA